MQADDERLILAIEEGDIPSAQALLTEEPTLTPEPRTSERRC